MRIYYDLEFLEDGRTIELISIGMVAEDGREYYAVCEDAPWEQIRESEWLMGHVVPTLTASRPDGELYDPTDPCVRSRRQIADEVRDFIRATPGVELWASYGAYDHVCLAQLWGSMMGLPDGVPMWTNDIQQEALRQGLTWADLPQMEDGEHNALADARHNRVRADFLDARATATAGRDKGRLRAEIREARGVIRSLRGMARFDGVAAHKVDQAREKVRAAKQQLRALR